MSSSRYDLTTGEIEILLDIGLNKVIHKSITSHSKAVTNPYIGLSINSLINRGYLEKDRTKRYQLTSLGRKVYVEIISKYDLDGLEALTDKWLREAKMAKDEKE